MDRIRNFFWGKGGFFDMGDRYPVLDKHNESTIPNLFIVGDVAGTPDIKAALNAGYDAAHLIAKRFTKIPDAAQFTVAIIGAGPAGLNAANECKKLGVPYVVFERREILSSIKVFEDSLPLYYPSTGEKNIRGDFPFQETTAKAFVELYTPMVTAMQLNIREHEEVTGIRKKGSFVITTASGEYRSAALVVAAGKLTCLKKLNVHEQLAGIESYETSIADLDSSIRVTKSTVDHRDMPDVMNISGLKFENTWDWKRYTWLGLALIASGVFYFEKKTEYGAIGLGAMLGIVTAALGGYYFIRTLLNAIDGLRFHGFKKMYVIDALFGLAVVRAGLYAFNNNLLDLWPRSLGAWYPALYSVLVVVFGIKAIRRWRDPIQTRKTITLIFFQLFFYWILPEFIIRNWLSYTLVYAWPLVLAPHTIRAFLDPSFDAGLFYFWWAIILTVVLMPAFVAATGKKYCSWVCGCGGLAETVGDSFRQYAPKGQKNIDREKSLYTVTGIALVLTIVVGILTLFDFPIRIAGISIGEILEKSYSWGVDWALVSFIPIALYPFFGGKIWCRYWCPTALYMQILSKWFTKRKVGYFKIEANQERCIACDLCSRYCEVGIDVMRFALKGTTIDNVNSSCIGCGVCISVCPTDVLTFGSLKLVQISIPPVK